MSERRLDERRAEAPDVQRRRGGRKNTQRWCKGKEGREHTLVVQLQEVRNKWARGWRCGERSWWSGLWSCNHEEICTTCGKITRFTLGKDCPDLPAGFGEGTS